MDLSQIKLIVTDLDGTLLNSNHEVSDLFFELFEALKKHDILFVAASGRPYYSIIEKLDPIKQNQDIHPVICTPSKAYFSADSSDSYIQILKEYYPNSAIIKSINDIKEDVIKIALYHFEDSEKHIYPSFKLFESDYDVKVSGKHWVDISDPLANKGHAIQMIQTTYDISQDETLVFGDYNNDLEMLKLATYSFAMANAHDNVLKTAHYKTKSNDEFGVEYILEKLLKAKG